MDRRTKYTRDVIKKALHTCLENNELNNITIKELCIEADVNRATFYRHYKDIFDLFDEIAQDFLKQLFTKSPGSEMSKELLRLTKEYQGFHKEYYNNHMDKPYVNVLQTSLCNTMKERESIAEGYASTLFEHQFYHYTQGVVALLKTWLENDCQEPTEVLYHSILSIIEKQYKTLKASDTELL